MTEKKTTLPNFRTHNKKKSKVETEKVNNILSIPTDNIIEINKLIYAEARLENNEIDIPL